MSSTTKFYIAIFLQRFPLFLIVFLAIAGTGVFVAARLPAVYTANAELLLEGAQIPDELTATTVQTNANEQLEIIQQRLLTRANLLDIAQRYRVFDDQLAVSPDTIVRRMRAQTTIRSIGGRDRATLMTISFRASSARKAAEVANEYVTRIEEQDVQSRRTRATQTEDFFSDEVERLRVALEEAETRILAFKNANSEALPERLEYNLSRRTQLVEQITQAQRDIAQLREQRQNIINTYERTGRIGGPQAQQLTPAQRRLQQLEDELSSALTVYSENNPRIRQLRAQIAQAETAVASEQGVTTEGPSQDSLLELTLAQIDARIDFLLAEVDRNQTESDRLTDLIDQTNSNAINLASRERTFANIQAQYNEAVQRAAVAEQGERIELLSKGQKLTVIEQATVPTAPSSPNRPVIAAGAVFAGLLAGVGLVVLLELLNKTIRRPAELVDKLGITPLVTLPYMTTARGRRVQRVRRLAVVMVILVGVPGVLYGVHTFYQPLDLLAQRVMTRLGV